MANIRNEIDIAAEDGPIAYLKDSWALTRSEIEEGCCDYGYHDAAKFGNDLIDGDPDDYGQGPEEIWDVSPYLRPVDRLKPIPR